MSNPSFLQHCGTYNAPSKDHNKHMATGQAVIVQYQADQYQQVLLHMTYLYELNYFPFKNNKEILDGRLIMNFLFGIFWFWDQTGSSLEFSKWC